MKRKKWFLLLYIVVCSVMLFGTRAYASVDSVFMGTYDLLNDRIEQPVPIEWYVIEANDDSFTLLSRYVIAERRINAIPETDWKRTELSRWLNSDFYDHAFSEQEKQVLIKQYDGYISLLKENDDKSNNEVIKNYPEIMLLEQTEEFQQNKWWLKLYPDIWLGLGTDLTNIRPFYNAKMFRNESGGGMAYYEAATYYAIENDNCAPNGYSVLEYGYPINEALAVRPLIVVDRNYVLQLMQIPIPNSESSKAIIVDGIIDAYTHRGANIFETLEPIFGDISLLAHSYNHRYETENRDGLEEEAGFVIHGYLTPFSLDSHKVCNFQVSIEKYKHYKGQLIHRLYLNIEDSSEKNDYTGSEVLGNTIEYYNQNEDWEYTRENYRFPYREKKNDISMSIEQTNNGDIVITLAFLTEEYDLDAFYSDVQFDQYKRE